MKDPGGAGADQYLDLVVDIQTYTHTYTRVSPNKTQGL